MLAWSIGSGLAIGYVLTAFALTAGTIMIRSEDVELEKRFGAEYAAYRKRVPAVLPRLPRRRPSRKTMPS
jgi:protein-S-isoprenylcysteine O-methyltransferase Ste14